MIYFIWFLLSATLLFKKTYLLRDKGLIIIPYNAHLVLNYLFLWTDFIIQEAQFHFLPNSDNPVDRYANAILDKSQRGCPNIRYVSRHHHFILQIWCFPHYVFLSSCLLNPASPAIHSTSEKPGVI